MARVGAELADALQRLVDGCNGHDLLVGRLGLGEPVAHVRLAPAHLLLGRHHQVQQICVRAIKKRLGFEETRSTVSE